MVGGGFTKITSGVGYGLLVGIVLTIGCVGAFRFAAHVEPASPNIIELEFAGSSKEGTALLEPTRQEARTPDVQEAVDRKVKQLRAGIRRDWLLIVSYVATLGWWCHYGGRHFRMRSWRRLARALPWFIGIAGAADAVENIFLLRLLQAKGADEAAAQWATAATIPKWLVIVCALVIAVAALLTGLGRLVRRSLHWSARKWPSLARLVAPDFGPEPSRTSWTRPEDVARWDWNRTVDPPLKGRRPPQVGVCFSGGGIRSATFNMGALQILARTRAPTELGGRRGMTLLQRTDFLSCVSGGAYIAGALQLLAPRVDLADHRRRRLLRARWRRRVWRARRRPLPAPRCSTFELGSPEENHVRLHGRYVADNAAEWFEGVARVLSGIVLNLLVFTLVLFVVARPLGWFQHDLLFHLDVPRTDLAEKALEETLRRTTSPMWFAVGWTAGLGLLVLLVGTVFGAVDNTWRRRLETMAFGFLALAAGVLLMVWLLPALAGAVPQLTARIGKLVPWANRDDSQAGATVLFVTAGGSLTASAMAIINRPAPTPESGKAPKWPALKTVRRCIGLALPYLAGLLLALIALIGFAVFTAQAARAGWDGKASFFGIDARLELGVWSGAAALLAALYLVADQTRWSLGPFYRRRLASAFAIELRGAHRNVAGPLPWRRRTTLSSYALPHPDLPEVLVCAAANLSDQEAAPPGRRAVSFVFGAKVVGGPEVGWASTKDFEAVCRGAIRADTTFLSCMAISGAAFASAMGRQSRGTINSLLAASNTRLGIWLPSPRYVAELRGQVQEPQYMEQTKGAHEGPWVRRRRFTYLFKELFGRYSLDDRFLYLTDGGHYENLGLIELLRRECRVIMCFDASGDDLISCGTFVEAIELAKAELGVRVEIDLSPLAPCPATRPTPGVLAVLDGRISKRSVVRGSITYPDGRNGCIFLAKASLTKDAPPVVLAHAAQQKKATFPNDSTGDQFFDESQFNAYSELGRHIAAKAVEELLAEPIVPTLTRPL